MIRPLFTRRFWTNDPQDTSRNSSKKRSNGYESHELSHQTTSNTPSRLGFRKVRDIYNVSVLQTNNNESEEKIMEGEQSNTSVQEAQSRRSDHSDQQRPRTQGITVKKEVSVSRNHGSLIPNWNAV